MWCHRRQQKNSESWQEGECQVGMHERRKKETQWRKQACLMGMHELNYNKYLSAMQNGYLRDISIIKSQYTLL